MLFYKIVMSVMFVIALTRQIPDTIRAHREGFRWSTFAYGLGAGITFSLIIWTWTL